MIINNDFEHTLLAGVKRRLQDLGQAHEKFTFFWETKSPFSQWHKAYFTALPLDLNQRGLPADYVEPLKFSSAEQFMMFHKALLFDDFETADRIHKTNNVREQKSLGRSIKGFDDVKWRQFRSSIVYQGNKEKFSQNEELTKALMLTTGTTLVEAAPDDSVWGIGITKDDPRAHDRATWQGTNLLGEILTFIRIEISGKY